VSDHPSPAPRNAGPLAISERLALARQHHGAGRLAEAEALYRGILQENPQHADALHLLGALAHQAGHHQAAIDLIRRALAIQATNAVYHSSLAVVYLATGRLDESAAHSREAVRLLPTHADAHYTLAVALLGQGRPDEAEPAFRETLRRTPAHADARCLLASLLRRQGKFPDAVALLSEAVGLAPGHVLARVGLGEALLDLGRAAAAEPHLREAVRLRPDLAAAHGDLGLALRDLDRTGEAAACFREALRLQPHYTSARSNLGLLLESEGRSEEARVEFVEVLRVDQNDASAFAGLSRLAAAGHYAFSEEQIRRVQSLASQGSRPADERARLHFAVARVRERAGAHDEAFGHYREANELLKEYLRARGAVYDPAAQSRLVDRLITAFHQAYFERSQSFGSDSEQPVFVVGMPRSGTTLAEQIIASHPRGYGAGELYDIDEIVTRLPQLLDGEYPDGVCRLDTAVARSLAEDYLRTLRQRGGMAARVVDKMPSNHQHLGLIATLLPRARIVHCVRDPLDTCLSCYFQQFAQPLPFQTDLTHLGHYYREYARLMTHWARVLPLPVFELRYEDLTADQEAVSRRLVEFCGLEWDERCLRFHESRRAVRTVSALQVHRPLYRSAVGRWKRYEKYLGPLIQALGQARASGGSGE
jgi:tetratricopeptide (TPR) repeat protein